MKKWTLRNGTLSNLITKPFTINPYCFKPTNPLVFYTFTLYFQVNHVTVNKGFSTGWSRARTHFDFFISKPSVLYVEESGQDKWTCPVAAKRKKIFLLKFFVSVLLTYVLESALESAEKKVIFLKSRFQKTTHHEFIFQVVFHLIIIFALVVDRSWSLFSGWNSFIWECKLGRSFRMH